MLPKYLDFDVTVLTGMVEKTFYASFTCFYLQVLSDTLGGQNNAQILAVAHRGSGSLANFCLLCSFSRHLSKIVQARPPLPPNFISPQYPVATWKGLPSQSQGFQEQVFTSCNWVFFLKILYLLARFVARSQTDFPYLFHLLVSPFIAVPDFGIISSFLCPPSTICSKPIQLHCSLTQ